ncbi:MAG: DUF1552 domain-containing protein [Rhodobacteraceae bacterium]|nr:DUF1552 domain-containing protein [Paracoccaceae bacterium]
MNTSISRRRLLRGTLGGCAISVGVPFLDCFLDGHGEALADGSPVPTRFGTWFWGLGMNKKIFVPKKTGPDFDLPEEIESLKPVQKHLNLFTNYRVLTDGRTNFCHTTGWIGLRCGTAPRTRGDLPKPSLDVLVSDAIGNGTRFRSLELAATGGIRDSYSFRSGDAINPPMNSATKFYQRVFGAEFQDPNNPNFKPDPRVMVRKSVLSAVKDQRDDLMKTLGTSDKARLDQYYTAIRELEGRLELQLQKPAPAEACVLPGAAPKELAEGEFAEVVKERHKAMTDLLVLAVACNQTRVINMVYSMSFANTVRTGFPQTHHLITHEEIEDHELGYQVQNSWYLRRAMEAWAYFVGAFANYREGNATLLDRMLIYAHSDQEYAKVHSIDGIPMFTAGTANGKLKTGLHIDGQGEPGTRVGYTVQKVLGMNPSSWGTDSMETNKEVSEILA